MGFSDFFFHFHFQLCLATFALLTHHSNQAISEISVVKYWLQMIIFNRIIVKCILKIGDQFGYL